MKTIRLVLVVLVAVGAGWAGKLLLERWRNLSPLAADSETGKEPKRKRGHITVGKETTYATDPLGKDGYVDYTAALNKRLRGDTTPANNANVLLWKAIGPHPEGVTMPPEFFEWQGVKPPPERGDYFVDFVRYVREQDQAHPVPGLPARAAKEAIDDQLSDAMRRPWTAKQYPAVAAWLKANEKPLALVVEATRRSHYYSPLVARMTRNGREALLQAHLSGVQTCRALAAALTTRAMLRVATGASDDAWQDLLACHRLGRLVGRGGTLLEVLVTIAIDSIAGQADLAFLDHAKPNAKRLATCLRDLQRLAPLPDVAAKIDLTERFILLETITMTDRHGIGYLESLAGDGPGKMDSSASGSRAEIDWDPALRTINRRFDALVAALREKDHPAREKKVRSIIEENAKEVKKSKAGAPGPDQVGKVIGELVVGPMLRTVVGKVQDAADRAHQNQDNLLLAFALARYQRDHSRYPKTLDALAPKFLPTIPRDLFSGKPLVYRPAADGYVLYSVGVNGKDDGGHGYADGPPADDLVIRMPLPRK